MLYYQDGRVTIYHANCHEMAGSIEADALVTDPPYGTNCGGVLASRYRLANGKNQLSLREPRFDHPTQKPLDVMKWCCSFLKLDSETVIVDPYMGSGTTLRAAKDLGCS